MMLSRLVSLFAICIALTLSLTSCAPPAGDTETATAPSDATVEDFVGQWALYVPDGASWLAVSQEDGYLDAELLWYGGSVSPVAHVFFNDGVLTVTRVSEFVADEASGRKMQSTSFFKLWQQGEKMMGKAIMPSRSGLEANVVKFEAVKVEEPGPAPDLNALTFGEPIQLFNGEDLTGWSLVNEEHVNGWSVEDGVLVNNPKQEEGQPHIHYGNLRTVDEFEDFNLKLEVNVPPNGNSGVYLRGMYEIQVMDSYGQGLDPHYMGGVYSRFTPSSSQEKPAGEWQEMDMTLCDRHITVKLNGVTTIDNVPVPGVTGGALSPDVFAPGPIYLQGDHDAVSYRNVVLTPIEK